MERRYTDTDGCPASAGFPILTYVTRGACGAQTPDTMATGEERMTAKGIERRTGGGGLLFPMAAPEVLTA